MSWMSTSIREVIVYKSVSHNIWANLALEDWIFKNVGLSWRRILFLWRNSPCVVIGRHQNPWLESNVRLLRDRGIALARRRSGGGTVYHDLGNLNCTVFTHRLDYSRPRNLWLVCDAINEGWGTRLHVNKRDDIIVNDQWKVSGSSAKLAKDPAYHHFTLLLLANMDNLRSALKPHPQLQISKSTATDSIRSKVINLTSLVPQLNYDNACSAIASKFYDVHNITEGRKVVDVDPTCENTFPDITAMRHKLKKWEWVYGKSPKFTVTASQELPSGELVFTAEIVHGVIKTCSLSMNGNHSISSVLTDLQNHLQGSRFWYSDIERVLVKFTNTQSNTNTEDISKLMLQLV